MLFRFPDNLSTLTPGFYALRLLDARVRRLASQCR